MSLWTWLRGRGAKAAEPAPAPPPPPGLAQAPPVALQADELLLERALSEALPSPLPAELYAAVERLVAARREKVALRLLGRLYAASPEDPLLALRLAQLLALQTDREGRFGPAVDNSQRVLAVLSPWQERLATTPGLSMAQRHQVRLLLSEALEATGERAAARLQVSLILAEDLDVPQARSRLQRLTEPRATEPRAAPAPRASSGELATLLSVGGVRYQRYQLVRELGRGGAGTVYLARDTVLLRELALKLFHAAARRGEIAAHAWSEARLTATVQHPGVVAIYDLDEERSLVAMELCRGGSLRERLRDGRLPAVVALGRGVELLETLTTMHQAGVVHGDLKPGNLLFRGSCVYRPRLDQAGDDAAAALRHELRQQGDLVIADFGTARLLGAPSGEDALAGTLGYVAPERRRDGGLEPAADLYAVGAVLLEMLLGVMPLSRYDLLRGEQPEVRLPAQAESELGPHVGALEALLRRLLSTEPAERPSAAEARAQLAALLPPGAPLRAEGPARSSDDPDI